MIMKPGLRKFALSAHVTTSVGWIGAVAAFLALALVGMTSQDTQMVRAAYLATDLTTWVVILPLCFASLLTGVISSLGTKWGLFRYYWILVKLVLTLIATFALLVHTQPIHLLAGVVAKTTAFSAYLQRQQLQLVVASIAALVVLLVLTVLSYYKPRGMTRYGWRKQHEERKDSTAVDATIGKAQGIEQERAGNGANVSAFK